MVGAQTVGTCLENERHNPANGNAEQRTGNGLLVWRKADNWTAFTDGYWTWINGPGGLAVPRPARPERSGHDVGEREEVPMSPGRTVRRHPALARREAGRAAAARAARQEEYEAREARIEGLAEAVRRGINRSRLAPEGEGDE